MRGKRVVEVSRVRRVSQKMERVYEVDECGSTSSVDGIPKQMKKTPRRAGLREEVPGQGTWEDTRGLVDVSRARMPDAVEFGRALGVAQRDIQGKG